MRQLFLRGSLSVARALLLDIALLNSDRQPWNVLSSGNRQLETLWYIDHDKSLFGDGRKPTEKPPGDLRRIDRASSITDSKVGDYLAWPAAAQIIIDDLPDQEILNVFDSLPLNSDTLHAAMNECPNEWIPASHASELHKFFPEWWNFLKRRLHKNSPRSYLKDCLTSRAVPR